MNIALLTYHRVPNFGANLQALVTTRQLAVRGHNVTTLDYIPSGIESYMPIECLKISGRFMRSSL